ncbi:uncharacterized protein RAG0_02699 [Rhynchosporium agropyri]|uniref:Uncharacterized protein n=1 Tax=Rhynchosporium agropyri TaxID=914238 RepID=A0A1E1K2E4_9HELO|nr:uncharacterized protein RAG0_02699 [Rhynchosporium agropyri]
MTSSRLCLAQALDLAALALAVSDGVGIPSIHASCIMHHASCMHAMQTPITLSVKPSPIAQEVHPPPTPRCPIWWNSLSIPSIPCITIRHQTSPEQSCREEGYIVPPLSSSGRHQYRYLQAGKSNLLRSLLQSINHSDTLAAIPP